MGDSGPDEDLRENLSRVLAKKKAIAGAVLIIGAIFSVSLVYTEAPSHLSGYFFLSEDEETEPDDAVDFLEEDFVGFIGRHEDIYEEDITEEEIKDWVSSRLREGYDEEDLEKVLERVGEDTTLVQEVLQDY